MHIATGLCPMCTYVLDVDRRGHDLDVVQAELRALRDDLAVQRDHRAAVVVQAIAVAALLVRVQVDAAELQGRQICAKYKR